MLVREGGSCERQKSCYGRDAAKDQRPDWRVSMRFVCMRGGLRAVLVVMKVLSSVAGASSFRLVPQPVAVIR